LLCVCGADHTRLPGRRAHIMSPLVPYLKDLDSFNAAVARTGGGRLLAIDFTAAWCGPCKMIGPRFEAMADSGQFRFVDFAKVDVDENQEVRMMCGIRSMPTFQMFRHGTKVAEFSGADESRLRALLQAHGGPPTTMPAGMEVTIVGLMVKPELNGRVAKVAGFDGAKARFSVQVDGETFALKRDNLVQHWPITPLAPSGDELPAAAAAASGGKISGYNVESGCYTVSLEPSGEAELPPACVRLPDECTGQVCGLQGAPEHNGKEGFILSFDAAADRYLVALDATNQLKLKRANFRA